MYVAFGTRTSPLMSSSYRVYVIKISEQTLIIAANEHMNHRLHGFHLISAFCNPFAPINLRSELESTKGNLNEISLNNPI